MKTTILFFALFFVVQLCGQTPEIDSLRIALSEAHSPQEKLPILNKISYSFLKVQSDSSLKYCQIAKRSDNLYIDNFHFLKILITEATALGQKGNFEDAENSFISILKKLEGIEKDSLLSIAENNYGLLLHKFGKNDEALTQFHNSIKHIEKLNAPFMVATINLNIGNIFFGSQNEKALKYINKAISTYENMQTVPFEIGSAYLNKSSLSGYQGDMEGVIQEAKKAIPFLEKGKNIRHLQVAFQNLNLAYNHLKQPEKAMFYQLESLRIAKSLNEPQMTFSALMSIAESYRRAGNFKEAVKYAQEGLVLAKTKKYRQERKTILEILAKSQMQLGAFEEATKNLNWTLELQDSLANEQTKQKIEEIEIKFQVKEKEQLLVLKEEQLKRRKNMTLAIGIITFILTLFLYYVWKNLQNRKKINHQLSKQSEQLKKLDKVKSRFFANISHELRTPLTLILAPLENAIQIVKSTSAKTELKTAHTNGKKLLTLVNEILDLSKLESGEMKLQESSTHLESLLRRIFFSYHSLALLRGFILSFSYHLPQDLAVKLDIGKFEKVINNLLSNAFKYSQPGGVITMRSSEEGNNLKIEIHDTGKGIPADELEKIFDRFYQTEGENQPLQGGTGIGLAYAKEITQLFGGGLQVESIVGKGSNFIFTIPLKKSELKPHIKDSDLTTNEIQTSEIPFLPLSNEKPHILVVEDNPEMSRFLIRSLSDHFRCTAALDGEEALKILETERPDLITSDVMMPNMDGFTLLEKVHEIEALRKTPFILLTARAMEEDKLRGLKIGVDDYLTKPFNTKELKARIWNLIRNKKVREEHSKDTYEEDGINLNIKSNKDQEILSYEDRFLASAEKLVLEQLSNSQYKVTDLARDLNYSSRQLERILKKNTGLSPVAFIRDIRLQRAYRFLENRQFATVAEVRYEVGMENASYFTKNFENDSVRILGR